MAEQSHKVKPKVYIDLSGGVVQQILATEPIDIVIVDYDDLESGNGRVVEIDRDPAYV